MCALRFQVAAAFAAVYLIWGSTYLAIRFVIETLPPFFMAGTRFLISGVILYALMRLRRSSKPTLQHWSAAALVGGLMLMGGHGAVVWAEQWVPSGLTSLLIATVPLWMVLLNWFGTRKKPNVRVVVGLILGMVGVALLVESIGSPAGDHTTLIGSAVIVSGAFLWASGSLYSRSKLPSSLLTTGMEMIVGGILLLTASFVTGEWLNIRLFQVSLRSAFSWIYLIIFGSLIGFTSYMWLLKTVDPERVSTYAYVNPVVALFLGWALANEVPSVQSMVAAGIILMAVFVITTYGTDQKGREETRAEHSLNVH